MSDWNPSLYLHFAAERSRPAVELLARVPLENIEYIAENAERCEGEFNAQMRVPGQHENNSDRKEKIE